MDRVERHLGCKIGHICFSLNKDSEEERSSRVTLRFVLCNCIDSLKVEINLSEISNAIL